MSAAEERTVSDRTSTATPGDSGAQADNPGALLCAQCGATLAADERYCPGCGTQVLVESTKSPFRISGRRSKQLAAASGLILILGALIAVTLLWRSELHARVARDASIVQMNATQARLIAERDGLKDDLRESKAVASRRAAVLVKVEAALALVEPLLSTVDELQAVTAKMQDSRDSYYSASTVLKTTLINLGNCLIRDDCGYYYVQSLIDDANAEIGTVDYYASTLSGYDASYSNAGHRFDGQASRFTDALRKLKKQLTAVLPE